MSYELTVTLDDLTIQVAYYEGDHGNTSGPPDNYRMPEPPEVEILSATRADGTTVELDYEDDEDLYERILKACDEPLRAIYDAEAEGMAAYEAEMQKAEAEYDAMLMREGLA